jgi:invasion protein IalB
MQSMKKKITGWLAVAALMTVPAGALAQQPTPRPIAKPAAPLARPAAVENSAQGAPSQLEVPQQTTATYADWVVQCQTQAGPPPAKVCDMAQVTQLQGKNVPFSRVALARPVRGQPVNLIVQVPVNASFATNVRIQTGDDDAGFTTPFAHCLPSGCFAEFELKEEILKKLRTTGGLGKMSFADAGGHDISVPLSFNGFAQAFDALAKE